MKIRLTEWAIQQGISYITAYRWAKGGKIPGLYSTPTNRLFVEVETIKDDSEVVLYAYVSSHNQKRDLKRQMGRLRTFASSNGLVIDHEITEIGSGLNGKRKKLVKLLQNAHVGTIIVEHRDKLARFDMEYIEAALSSQNRRILVVSKGEHHLDLTQDFVDVITSLCARIYGRQGARNRARRALKAASE